MKKILIGAVIGLVCFGLRAPAALPQSSDDLRAIRKEMEGLRRRQEAIHRELQELRKLIQEKLGASEDPEVIVDIDDDPVKGDKNAKLTLIEFSDYECPFCGRHFRETMPQIEKNYIRTGRLKYVFRDFPLEAIHPQALKASEAANCAGEQGRYWEMHDRLFAHQKQLGAEELPGHARALALDVPIFQACLSSGKHEPEVRKDMLEGRKAGVKGTPTFFIGLTDPDSSKVKAAKIIVGAQPYSTFEEAIEEVLGQTK